MLHHRTLSRPDVNRAREATRAWLRGRQVATVLGLAAVYFVAGKLGLALAFIHPSASAVWPPTGVALAALLLLGSRVWPGVLLGAFLVNVTTGGGLASSVGIATGNTLEGLVGAWLVRRYAGGPLAFESVRNVFKFAALTGLFATPVSATVGVTSLAVGGLAPWSEYGSIWLTWWLGDAAGALVVAPVLLLWTVRPLATWTRNETIEAAVFLASLLLSGMVVFSGLLPSWMEHSALSLVLIPILVWAAFRLGPPEAAAATLLISAIAICGTLEGHGPFARESPNESLMLLQAFMGVMSVTATAIGAVVAERRRAEEALRDVQAQLEVEVLRRTEELTNTIGALEAEVATRTQRERELHESGRRLTEAQALAHVGSWRWDAAGKLMQWSDELYRICGFEPGSIPATHASFVERVHSDDRARVDLALRLAHDSGGPFAVDHRIQRPDGNVRWLHTQGNAVIGPDGRATGLHGTIQDITERIKAESTHKLLAAIVENSLDAIIGQAPDGTIVSWNNGAERLYGYRAQEMLGRNIAVIAPPDRTDGIVELLEKLRRGESIPRLETERVAQNGRRIHVSLTASAIRGPSGEIAALSVIERDISDKKLAEDALKESEERFRSIAQLTNEGIIVADSGGRILWWNEAARSMFGCTEGDGIGKPLTLLMPERHREAHKRNLERFAASEQRPIGRRIELQGLRGDGGEFPLEMSLTSWSTRGATYFGGIVRDVTERKRAEEQVRRLNVGLERRVEKRTAELARSNEELKQFAYVASHDLQEPLRMVSSFVQILADRYRGRLDQDADEFIHFAVDGAQRMHELINGLLAYSRLEKGTAPTAPVDCEEALRRALDNLELRVQESGADISHGPLPTVLVDATSIIQLFQNLVGNAIKFRRDVPPRIRIEVEPRDRECVFSVRDNGIGIDPKQADRIFVIFQRLHSRREYPGTGIGLAICKKIVEQHRGRIWLESQPGRGSVFYFTLPSVDEAANDD